MPTDRVHGTHQADQQFRRRVPRQLAGWPGRYAIDEPAACWDLCQVVDFTMYGAGLELFGAVPSDIVGCKIIVEVEAGPRASVSVRLSGEAKNSSPGSAGGVRVGIEFTGISPVERSVLQVLEQLHLGW